ncbi:autotransporter outer membrane beta-barrel domain-containing protein, partial [Delftia tsuruhatensis]
MNRIFCSVWNAALGAWVAVAETMRAHGAAALASAGLVLLAPGAALPQQVNVGPGQTLTGDGVSFAADQTGGGAAVLVDRGVLSVEGGRIDITSSGDQAKGVLVDSGSDAPATLRLVAAQGDLASIRVSGSDAQGIYALTNSRSMVDIHLERVDLLVEDADPVRRGVGIFLNARGRLKVLDTVVRARSGIDLFGLDSAFLQRVRIVAGDGVGLTVGAGGRVINDMLSQVEVRDFDIVTGVDPATGQPVDGSGYYGIHTGNLADTLLSDGRVQTRGNNAHGIRAWGDWKKSGPVTLRVRNVDIVSQGNGAYGIDSSSVRSEITGGSILTGGSDAQGVVARGGSTYVEQNGSIFRLPASQVSVDGTKITTQGRRGYGLFAHGGAIDARNVSITTSGDTAYGLQAKSSRTVQSSGRELLVENSSVSLTGSTILTSGEGSHGAVLIGEGTLDLTDSAIQVKGKNAVGLAYGSRDEQPRAGSSRISGSQVRSEQSAAVYVAGGIDTLSLSDSTVESTAPKGVLLQLDRTLGGDLTVLAERSRLGGDLDLKADSVERFVLDLRDHSEFTGAALDGRTEGGSIAHRIAIDGSSVWKLRGDSTVNDLSNDGSIEFVAPTADDFKTLTVEGDYSSNNGRLQLSTRLGGDGSPTDRAIFKGDVQGVTRVAVANAGGLGAKTQGDGIHVIEAPRADQGAFVQEGRIAAGAYDYTLHAGLPGGTQDGNWY